MTAWLTSQVDPWHVIASIPGSAAWAALAWTCWVTGRKAEGKEGS